MKREKFFYLTVLFAAWMMVSVQSRGFAQQDGEDIVIGTYRTMHSDILDEDRLLFIHLPRSYETTQLAYPVLYLLYVDIYNYFADAVITTEKLGGTGEMPPMIIVGVANTNRYRDLLPVPTRGRSEGGGAGKFLQFLEGELIPHIDQHFRTQPFRILAGPQTAAIFSLFALIEKPDLFQATIAENPFMNPENAAVLYPRAERFLEDNTTLKHFLYIKCEQSDRPEEIQHAENLVDHLDALKPAGLRYHVAFEEPSGYFIKPMPFRDALRMLFAAYKLPEDIQTQDLEDITGYYAERSVEYGFKVDPPEHMLTFEGVELNRQGKTPEAIRIFEYQHQLYPRSLNALFQLGESYRGLGAFEKAARYYRAFLEIEDRDAALIERRLVEMERKVEASAAYRIEQAIRERGIRAGLKRYREFQSDPESHLYFDEGELNAIGYRLMGAGNMAAAVEIFKINVELYPESANVYDSLGEAYLKSGNKKQAIEHYERSLELNPENDNAKAMLERLMEE